MKTKFLLSSAAAATFAAAVFTSAPAGAQTTPYIGELRDVGFNFCPRGWVLADGRALAIAGHTALFSLYGTTYGGDGRTTFRVPNLVGRNAISFGIGPGLSNYNRGQKGGSETITLNTNTMGRHSHPATTVAELNATADNGNTDTPGDTVVLANARGTDIYGNGDNGATLRSDAITATTTPTNTGAGTPIEHRGPYQATNWCVALEGIYPSRS